MAEAGNVEFYCARDAGLFSGEVGQFFVSVLFSEVMAHVSLFPILHEQLSHRASHLPTYTQPPTSSLSVFGDSRLPALAARRHFRVFQFRTHLQTHLSFRTSWL